MTTDEDVRRYAMGQWCSCIIEHRLPCTIGRPRRRLPEEAPAASAVTAPSRAERRRRNQIAHREIREAVFARDQGLCRYCGEPGDTLDHVWPLQMGGETTLENCVVACIRCNGRKGNSVDWKPQPVPALAI